MYFVAILACVCADGTNLLGRGKLLMQDSERLISGPKFSSRCKVQRTSRKVDIREG